MKKPATESYSKNNSFSAENRWVGFFRRAQNSYIEFHHHAEYKITFVSMIGAIGFPLFYLIWANVVPQYYESFFLRLVGCALCLTLVNYERLPKVLLPYRIGFAYFALGYSLPFFFTFMLLMNDGSIVWLLSFMAALMFLVLLYDTLNIVIVMTLGVSLATVCYWLSIGAIGIPQAVISALPVFGFTLVGILLLNYRDDIVLEEKRKAAAILAGHIAHEVRTPLLGIKMEAEKAGAQIPGLIGNSPADIGEQAAPLKSMHKDLAGFSKSMERIEAHVTSANLMIDMLLMNVRHQDIMRRDFTVQSMRGTIETAIDRYHFKATERDRVQVELQDDFEYWGSDVLMMHVMFNLFRNALRATASKNDALISIRLRPSSFGNQLVFFDNGEGMDANVVKYIFLPFFSGTQHSTGTGIGLSFSKQVIESFNGSIACYSKSGAGTEFRITLPSAP